MSQLFLAVIHRTTRSFGRIIRVSELSIRRGIRSLITINRCYQNYFEEKTNYQKRQWVIGIRASERNWFTRKEKKRIYHTRQLSEKNWLPVENRVKQSKIFRRKWYVEPKKYIWEEKTKNTGRLGILGTFFTAFLPIVSCIQPLTFWFIFPVLSLYCPLF